MKIGISPGSPEGLYKEVGSRPMHEGIYDENGGLIWMRYLSVPQLRRTTEDALRYAERLGMECIEIYNTLDRIEAIIPVLKHRGDEITIVLENEDEAGAGYKEEWEKLKKLRAVYS